MNSVLVEFKDAIGAIIWMYANKEYYAYDNMGGKFLSHDQEPKAYNVIYSTKTHKDIDIIGNLLSEKCPFNDILSVNDAKKAIKWAISADANIEKCREDWQRYVDKLSNSVYVGPQSLKKILREMNIPAWVASTVYAHKQLGYC